MLRRISGSTFEPSNRSHTIVSSVQLAIVENPRRLSLSRNKTSLGPAFNGRSVEISGAWPCRTPKSPSLPGTTTMSASVASTSRSGMTSWKEIFAIASGRFGRELLGLGDGLVDRADHVEGGFRQVVVVAGDDALEGLDGVLELHEHARRAGED